MAEERRTDVVSQSNFYATLSVTWIYILLLVGNQLHEQATQSRYLLFAGATVMSLSMSILGIRARKRKSGGI